MSYDWGPKLRAKTLKNVALVNLPDSIARESMRQNGMLAAETAWIWGRSSQEVLAHCEFEPKGEETLRNSVASGRPSVLMTPHVGGYEALPICFYEQIIKPFGKHLVILYREPKNALIRPFIRHIRDREGIDPASADLGGVKKIIKDMRQGGLLGCLPDQVPGRGEGVWVPFFGRPAFTMSFPMKVARQFNADIFIAYAQRLEGKGWKIYIQQLHLDLNGNAEHDAALMNQEIEKIVMKVPEQYIWNYNRFKGLNHYLEVLKKKETRS